MTTLPRTVALQQSTSATSFWSITLKATLVHTVSYFGVGLLAFTLLDYRNNYADASVAASFRQMDDPLVAAGPLFQVLRGMLFGCVFYALRELVFAARRGWLVLWLMLLMVGIFSPFGAAPGSIEGMVYSIWPLWFHLLSLPELLLQSLLLAYLSHYWVSHPEKKWLAWSLGLIFALVVTMSTMGLLAALGVLPRPG